MPGPSKVKTRTSITRIAITVGAVAVAAANLKWPDTLNAVTLGCLAVAVLPWLGAVFRSVELPSGLKVEYKDVKEVADAASAAGLLAPELAGVQPVYATLVDQDPNLALAGLRIDLERKLEILAERAGIVSQRRGIGSLLRQLEAAGKINQADRSVLLDLLGLLNSAVHGAVVSKDAAAWAMKVGPELLQGLEQRGER